jgi:hypothetical protein
VHQHERRPFADALICDLETAGADNLHKFTLPRTLERLPRVTLSPTGLRPRLTVRGSASDADAPSVTAVCQPAWSMLLT